MIEISKFRRTIIINTVLNRKKNTPSHEATSPKFDESKLPRIKL